MPKTRKTHKRGAMSVRPYRSAQPYVVEQGEQITTTGFRGRTEVIRLTDPETGKRIVGTIRRAPEVVQKPAKNPGAKVVNVGRAYTGVARGKSYPYASTRRGAAPVIPDGLLSRTSRAIKRVLVRDAAE